MTIVFCKIIEVTYSSKFVNVVTEDLRTFRRKFDLPTFMKGELNEFQKILFTLAVSMNYGNIARILYIFLNHTNVGNQVKVCNLRNYVSFARLQTFTNISKEILVTNFYETYALQKHVFDS